jgi:toluene monooxygenase electron transfer component
MCQCAAEEALSLEVSKFVYPMQPGACVPRALGGTLRKPRPLTHDVTAFSVELDEARDFDAGQFWLLAPQGLDGYRGYSMCNFERGVRSLDFIVKRKPGGGFSEWLFGADRDGARLETFGPLGKATFDPALGKNVLCIAGGSGIAGMMSILARAQEAGYFDRHKVWVFFGVRTMKDAFFLEELSSYTKADITVALSEEDPPGHEKVKFERGFVHEVAKRAMAGRYQDVRAFVAGPPPAVDAAIRVLLLEAKLTTDNIRYDKYS